MRITNHKFSIQHSAFSIIFTPMTRDILINEIHKKHSFLCVGLDTDITKLPLHLQSSPNAMVEFNKAIIDATSQYCVAYKINTAFYEALGAKGWEAMEATVNYIPATHLRIADAKRGDIGNTASQYAKAFFETLQFDAITVAPYMGEDSVRPFLEYDNKWTIVLGLTSNKGANDFQKLMVNTPSEADTMLIPNILLRNSEQQLYKKVIEQVATWGNPNNLMFVAGATRASELEDIRDIVPNHFLLVPGVGSQGGDLQEVCKYGLNKDIGLLVNASRNIIYASGAEDFAEAASLIAAGYQVEMGTYIKDKLD